MFARQAGWLTALVLYGCGGAAPEVTLSEMENAKVEQVSVGLGSIEPQKIWRNGKRVSVDFATVLVRDTTTNTIQRQRVWLGDDLTIGGGTWTVVSIVPGTKDTRGRVVLRRKD